MARAGNMIGGKYRLLHPIGEGSMGAVWKAIHETLERPFAVKFLKDLGDSVGALEARFLAEARLAAHVRHRSVVDVVDFGVTDEGTPYMVMEYLEGVSLAERMLQRPPLSVVDLLRIMHQALGGLDAVHRAGILHRDLKPENIVLVPDNGSLVAKLIDFGISRPLDPVAPDDDAGLAESDERALRLKTRRLTKPGTTLGTPWYMAPEQARASNELDVRADLYAAGVILYEAITGRLPFEHEDAQIVLMMVVAGGAPPMSVYRPELPAELSDLVMRAMALDPDERFASAPEFGKALRAVAELVPEDTLCRRRGEGTIIVAPLPAPTELTPVPIPKVIEAKRATLPLALARMGFIRMPSRTVLLGAGAVMMTSTLALAFVLRTTPPAAVASERAKSVAALPPAATSVMPQAVSSDIDGDGDIDIDRDMARSSPASRKQPARTVLTTGFGTGGVAPNLPGQRIATRSAPNPAADKSSQPARKSTRNPPEVFRSPGF